MNCTASPYCLSIETDAGTYQHGFHLGTDLRVALSIAEDAFWHLAPKIGTHIKTVALIQDRRMVDCFDGAWSSDRAEDF